MYTLAIYQPHTCALSLDYPAALPFPTGHTGSVSAGTSSSDSEMVSTARRRAAWIVGVRVETRSYKGQLQDMGVSDGATKPQRSDYTFSHYFVLRIYGINSTVWL